MKKVIIAALTLIGFSAASFAQSTPSVKKTEPSKMQVVKKIAPKSSAAKIVAMNKVTKPIPVAVAKTPVVKNETKPVTVTKPVAVANRAAVAKTNAAALLKKDGTSDRRFKANQNVTKATLKKDGTPDMRFKANKKHS